MFLTMFFKTPNIVPTMHLTMLIAHPYLLTRLDPAEGAEAPADSDYLSVSVHISELFTFR